MANLTDPLVGAIQGSDPQNLMEYITRQKIYDSRFWKEECFGLTAADVLEKAAKTIHFIGGTYGASQRPTKFLCLILKLLQLQPDVETIIDEFIRQDYFKYVKVLGAFYLRLTGRPAEIYETLEPLYKEFSKLKVRRTNEWELIHMDEAVHQLLNDAYFMGMTLPRLPARETLQQEGYLEDGPRQTALDCSGHDSLEAYLRYRARVEGNPLFLALWNKRRGNPSSTSQSSEAPQSGESRDAAAAAPSTHKPMQLAEDDNNEPMEGAHDTTTSKRKADASSTLEQEDYEEPSRKKKKKKKDKGYGTLFKKDKRDREKPKRRDDESSSGAGGGAPEEGSEEYWNEQRAKLGLKPLRK